MAYTPYAHLSLYRKEHEVLVGRSAKANIGAWFSDGTYTKMTRAEFDMKGIAALRHMAKEKLDANALTPMTPAVRNKLLKGFAEVNIWFDSADIRLMPTVTKASGRGWSDKTDTITLAPDVSDAEFLKAIDKAFAVLANKPKSK